MTLCSFSLHPTPKLFIFIGPSGVGKTTLTEELQKSGIPLEQVITTTTRAPRSNEQPGKSYFFLSTEEFDLRKANHEFLAATVIYQNSYGISKSYIQEKLASNQNLACALTADGAQELKQSLGHQVVTIFVMPPSPQELEKRLQHRNTKDLQIRLQNAALEMEQQDAFDYKIVNDDLAQSTQELIKIFSQETK
ncbi:guanylate kinase [candidate division TM6 bacterium RIFCSPHIGHO2_12_FULL_38_8]|nr:MAG: guanylate kinase [candidate division TM6 bacterium RIFCSPHIGHO2_12_FULL_38_8]